MVNLELMCTQARNAARSLVAIEDKKINFALCEVAKHIRKNAEYLIEENAKDIQNAKDKGLSEGFIDRLTLDETVIENIAYGVEQVATLPSPLGKEVYSYKNEKQNIDIKKITVAFGVIGIIYESRPNVTLDAFALCFKAGNAVILKGGSDSLNSNRAIVNVIKQALSGVGINQDAISLIDDTSRQKTFEFMKMKGYVDLLIPRGGASLIKTAVENSTIPIIETGTGNCHVYIDKSANYQMAAKVIFNAKTQRYSVCNACESIVCHKDELKCLIDVANLLKEKKVEIRADEQSYEILKDYPYIKKATEQDFATEYGDAIISIKTVDDINEAIEHINNYSTHHSEAIITENKENASKFMRDIDSSSVYHNASTRFSDGFVFGLGAEIGISTQKLHARGPMGLDALVTTKYLISGDGSIRK